MGREELQAEDTSISKEKAEISGDTEKLASKKAEEARMKEDIEKLKAELRDLQKKEDGGVELSDEEKKLVADKKREIQGLENSLGKLREELQAEDTSISKEKAEISTDTEKLATKKAEEARIKEDIEKLQAELGELQKKEDGDVELSDEEKKIGRRQEARNSWLG